MDSFSNACSIFGLTISLKKAKVMYTPAGTAYTDPTIKVNDTILGRLFHLPWFLFIERWHSWLWDRISTQEGRCLFGRLEKRVWPDRGISQNVKTSVHKAVVLSSLLYSCKTWTTYARHIRLLERLHQISLRKILRINWDSFTPDTARYLASKKPSFNLSCDGQVMLYEWMIFRPHKRIFMKN